MSRDGPTSGGLVLALRVLFVYNFLVTEADSDEHSIGDWYPERSIFQILIALTSGPRFALVATNYFLSSSQNPDSSVPVWTFIAGIARTLSCGGWVYITYVRVLVIQGVCAHGKAGALMTMIPMTS